MDIQAWMAWVTQALLDQENPVPPFLGEGGKRWVNLPPPPTWVQDDRYCTFLSQTLTDSGSVVNVLSNALFPPAGGTSPFLIAIDQEAIMVSNSLGTIDQLAVVGRGQLGTIVTGHLQGSIVSQLLTVMTTFNGASPGATQITVADGTQFPTDGNFMVLLDPSNTSQESATVILVQFSALANVTVGATITGTGIPVSTTITAIYGLAVTLSNPANMTGSGVTFTVGAYSFTGATISGSSVINVTGNTQAVWTFDAQLTISHSPGAVVTQQHPDGQSQVTRILFQDNAFIQPGPLPGWVIHREVLQVLNIPSLTLNANGKYNATVQVWDDLTGTLVSTIPVQVLPNS